VNIASVIAPIWKTGLCMYRDASGDPQTFRKGDFKGIRTNIADYKKNDALKCDYAKRLKLAETPTRLAKLSDDTQERLINWATPSATLPSARIGSQRTGTHRNFPLHAEYDAMWRLAHLRRATATVAMLRYFDSRKGDTGRTEQHPRKNISDVTGRLSAYPARLARNLN